VFFDACDDDKVIGASRMTMNALYLLEDYEFIILTGRSESVRKKTVQWLWDNHIQYDDLVMGPEKDYQPDYVFKKKWAEGVGFENIVIVFEDRQPVVDMWRENGVFCLQVMDLESRAEPEPVVSANPL
jgi:hypothetical protein